MKRSSSYVTTLDPMSTVDMEKLQDMRRVISAVNKQSSRKYRVVVRGRLGKNNPEAYKYDRSKINGLYTIRLEDAVRYDVYINERFDWNSR